MRAGAARRGRATAGFSEAMAVPPFKNNPADGQSTCIDCDLAGCAQGNVSGAHVQVLRAGESKVAIPLLGVIVGKRDSAAAGVVNRAAGNDEGIVSVTQSGSVVDVERSGAQSDVLARAAEGIGPVEGQ